MDRNRKLLIACTIAIVLTLIGCTYWLGTTLYEELRALIKAVEELPH
jgi:hypothetical protein